MDKKWLNIEGSVFIDVDEDTFDVEFLTWLESKGWIFAGVTGEEAAPLDTRYLERLTEELDDAVSFMETFEEHEESFGDEGLERLERKRRLLNN